MTKAIYRFHRDYGRSGELAGIFVEDRERMSKAMGKRVYMDDVLGKHSEVSFSLSDEDIELVTDNANAVEIFEEYKLYSGYNPLYYIDDDEEDE